MADYRDRHLGPELKAFRNLQSAHADTKVTVHARGQSAYATSRYTLKAKMGERDIDSEGLATYVLIKGSDGAWQIRHSHTSSRARRPAEDCAIEMAIDFGIMSLVMYTMIDTVDHLYFNVNNVCMTLMMVAPMALVVLVSMWSMFSSKTRNMAIEVAAVVVFVPSYGGMRTQNGG